MLTSVYESGQEWNWAWGHFFESKSFVACQRCQWSLQNDFHLFDSLSQKCPSENLWTFSLQSLQNLRVQTNHSKSGYRNRPRYFTYDMAGKQTVSNSRHNFITPKILIMINNVQMNLKINQRWRNSKCFIQTAKWKGKKSSPVQV